MSDQPAHMLLLDVDRVLREVASHQADLVGQLRTQREARQSAGAAHEPAAPSPLDRYSTPVSYFAPPPALPTPFTLTAPPAGFLPRQVHFTPFTLTPPAAGFVPQRVPFAPFTAPTQAPVPTQPPPTQPAIQAYVQPVASAAPVAPAVPAPQAYVQPVAPPEPAPQAYVQPVAPAAPAPQAYVTQPAVQAYVQPVAPATPAPQAYVTQPSRPSVYNPPAHATKRDYDYFADLEEKIARLAQPNGNGSAAPVGTTFTAADWNGSNGNGSAS